MTPQAYATIDLTRAELEALTGPTVVEFGSNYCGICAAAQSDIGKALAPHPELRHLKVQDGSGQPMGRLFGVKLWPTLVFLQDGKEVTRVVRPRGSEAVRAALDEALAAAR
jgi:thioredoxin 1